MALWNFCHDVLHTHLYYVLSAVVALVMGCSLGVQRHNQKKRDKDNKKELSEQDTALKAEQGGAEE